MLTRKVFTVYPAIDVLEGRAVRLSEGRRERVTIEAGDPAALAARWAGEGATWLHLVDLDGAFDSSPSTELVRRVAAAGVPVQVGGGYRSVETIEAGLAAGATRVLVGTAALSPGFLDDATARFGESLVVAIDARDGRVEVDGWTKSADVSPTELARRCAQAGVARLLVTSTRRDGSLAGPDLELLEEVLAASTLPVVAAGGISSLDDLRAVRELGCEGAVAGSALLQGRFSLADAASLEG
ncbi:MAG: 1-(5-phosphoribosyl)-5-[(5-phosphoribosylamino)methylideneamino] imidazole-4-carboxamide isomerase [Actinobacteria bacterium]|nr:1-(5-phosphoribosyl)-5-[(5-phosphoribosylamino)methylideneamino] imidazole-4-carboxamide isomerase [Actinomycetota bacterium]